MLPDLLRGMVLAEGGVIALLYLHRAVVLGGAIVRRSPPPATSPIVGHLARLVACLLLLGVGLGEVASRMGTPTVSIETPILQIAVFALVVAYGFVDRKQVRDGDGDVAPAAGAAIVHMAERDTRES